MIPSFQAACAFAPGCGTKYKYITVVIRASVTKRTSVEEVKQMRTKEKKGADVRHQVIQ